MERLPDPVFRKFPVQKDLLVDHCPLRHQDSGREVHDKEGLHKEELGEWSQICLSWRSHAVPNPRRFSGAQSNV
jgi:hypothetical protein